MRNFDNLRSTTVFIRELTNPEPDIMMLQNKINKELQKLCIADTDSYCVIGSIQSARSVLSLDIEICVINDPSKLIIDSDTFYSTSDDLDLLKEYNIFEATQVHQMILQDTLFVYVKTSNSYMLYRNNYSDVERTKQIAESF